VEELDGGGHCETAPESGGEGPEFGGNGGRVATKVAEVAITECEAGGEEDAAGEIGEHEVGKERLDQAFDTRRRG